MQGARGVERFCKENTTMMNIDEEFADLMVQSDIEVAEPVLEENGNMAAITIFTGTCNQVCTALTHYACCISG